MDDLTITIQSTPNPNAVKFILNKTVCEGGKVNYKRPAQCLNNPLAEKLFSIEHVKELYFFENVITVTQDGQGDWNILMDEVKKTLRENIQSHNPHILPPEEKPKTPQTPELVKINEILDRTVRPYLQNDGGDLQLISLEGKRLIVSYEGACGSCPTAVTGTLRAIENVLKSEYDPEIEVYPINSPFFNPPF